jgi:dTDP-3-amino-3,4,6-trideoxy-alpha-D-glucose transaminase
MKPILLNDFRAQWSQHRAEVLAAVERVGQSGWLILGTEVARFEEALAEYWGLPFCVGCASGLDAIEIALRAAGLRPGQKALTTPLSAFATSLAVIRAGGEPVFVDVDDSGQIDLSLCEDALEADDEIRFMLPVHLYGHAIDLERLDQLKGRYSTIIVEDCAQAVGARSRQRPVGSVGDFAATSFYPTKNLGAMGDGGAVLTHLEHGAHAARVLRDYGQTGKFVHDHLGLNSRLDELHAAILRTALLPDLEPRTSRRREIAARYDAGIDHAEITTPPRPAGSESVWHLYPLLVRDGRDALQAHLREADIATAVHYPTLIPAQKALADRYPGSVLCPLPKAESFAKNELSIPIHPFMTDENVDRVIDACNAWRG